MSGPRVSVIVPVYNASRYLGEALESIAWQTAEPAEVIVVDDGSTDCSAKVAESFAGVRVLRQENAGVSAARNAGVAAATGDHIAFCDADDLWFPDKLERQLAMMPAPMVLAVQRVFLADGLAEAPAWLRADALGEPMICNEPSSWVMPRATFDAVGPFDTSYRRGEDWEWLNRARRLGHDAVLCDAVLLLRRIHTTNLSYGVLDTRGSVLRMLRKSAALNRQTAATPGSAADA